MYTLIYMNEDYDDFSCGLRQFPKSPMPEFPNQIPLGKGNLSNDMPFWVFAGDVAGPENCSSVISDNLENLAAYNYEVLWSLHGKLPRQVFERLYEESMGEKLRSKDHL